MRFTETPLEGLWIVDSEPRADDRGSFARVFAAEAFEAQGLACDVVHINTSANVSAGTVRGMHFQRGEHAEIKIVRCTRGAVYDVVVDVREDSPTRHHWYGLELDAESRRQLYIPKGFAHGFQTLVPNSELTYLVSAAYAPDAEGGLRWDDPTIGITWPLDGASAISDKDRAWPLVKVD